MSESPCPVTELPQVLTQLSDFMKERSKPVTPILSPPRAKILPLRVEEVSSAWPVTHSPSHFLQPQRGKRKNVSPRKKLSRQYILHSSAQDIFILISSNVAAHKRLVRSQEVELRSAEVRVFIWSADLSPWVYPDADWTTFKVVCSLICTHTFPVLP